MQQSLFEGSAGPRPVEKNVTVGKAAKAVVTKQQKEFKRLSKKIEDLRKQKADTEVLLENQLKYYIAHIAPLEERLLKLRTACVKLTFPFFTAEKKGISKKEKPVLGELIEQALGDVFYLSPNDPDKELKEIYEAVTGQNYDEEAKEEEEEMREEMERMFRQMGLDVDLSAFNSELSPEELAVKMKELQEELLKQTEQLNEKKTSKKKGKQQMAREALAKQKEELAKKSVSSVYKQLAKLFHPDLEKDENLKIEKEELMKQLTAAYEKEDLHTLLKLEMQWIQKEGTDFEKLGDEAIAAYNQMLKDQVDDLEMDIDSLRMHPRFAKLSRFEGQRKGKGLAVLKEEEINLTDVTDQLEVDISGLQGPHAAKYLKDLIKAFDEFKKDKDLPFFDLDEIEDFFENFDFGRKR